MLLPFFDKRFLRPCLIWTSLVLLGMRALDAQVVYEQVYSFGSSGDSGSYPNATPLIGLDGRLYGSTLYGGAAGAGTLYRVERNGSDFVVLHAFSGPDGSQPIGGLAQDEAGVLYGAAAGGGSAPTVSFSRSIPMVRISLSSRNWPRMVPRAVSPLADSCGPATVCFTAQRFPGGPTTGARYSA